MAHVLFVAVFSLLASAAGAVETYLVDPAAGNNTFVATFESEIGERITANSSQVQCDLTLEEKTGITNGRCSVPLVSIDVDMNEIKRAHFQQWATNKKSKPEACRFEVDLVNVKPDQPLEVGKPAPFTTDAVFTICGKKRTDGGKERVTGTALLLPSPPTGERHDASNTPKRVKIRARVAAFHRDQYLIGPKFTDGWLARVEQLGPVVSEVGTIELALFAKQTNAPTASAPAPAK